jgi:hypothetical protein
MATSQNSVNIFALSTVPQADYQTPLTPTTTPKNFRQIEKKDRTFAKYNVISVDNKGYSTGTPYPTRKEIEAHDVDFSLSEDASSQLLVERAKAGMGICDTVEVLANTVYKHTCKLINPQDNAQQPAYGYVEKAGESASRPNAHNVQYPSVVAGSFAVKGSGKSKLSVDTSWKGSGKRTVPSGINFFSTSNVKLIESLVQNFFRNTQASLKLYPEVNMGGTVFNVACAFRDFDFSVNQDLLAEAGYLGCGLFQDSANPESGVIRGNCEVGSNQSVTFDFTILMDDAYDAYEKLKTMASLSGELKYEGKTISGAHKHYALFKLLAGNIMDIDHVEVDGKNGLRIKTAPLAQGQIMPVELEVVNNVKSYTVAADTW